VPEGWIPELQPRGGGGAEWPGGLGHYGTDEKAGTSENATRGFIDLIAGTPPYLQGNRSVIEVLGRRASVGDIHEGYSVEFTHGECDFVLLAYGIDRPVLSDFAQGLRLVQEPGPDETNSEIDPEWFGAIWPEESYEAAEQGCALENPADSWRADPVSTRLNFAVQVLGWEEPVHGKGDEVRRDGSAESPVVIVSVVEFSPECWIVTSVSRTAEEAARHPENEGAMLSIQGRKVQMYFGDMRDAVSAILEVGYGGEKTQHVWKRGDDVAEFTLDFEPQGRGHYLVMLRDENGEVFSAFGSAIPEGNFAAG
jgi:hypothetical protein